LNQDQIVIDIEESELEVVRSEFGEIDEFDDLTLKARRRAVIDVLQDEVELEDVTSEDDESNGEVGDDDASNGEDEDGDVAREAEDADRKGQGEDVADSAAVASDAAPGDAARAAPVEAPAEPRGTKKRRRRRRRKRSEPNLPDPELTAPPHKDFWEVWAARFSFRDFEDEVYGAAEPPEDTETAPRSPTSTIPSAP
jgi:hypothetical protein